MYSWKLNLQKEGRGRLAPSAPQAAVLSSAGSVNKSMESCPTLEGKSVCASVSVWHAWEGPRLLRLEGHLWPL